MICVRLTHNFLTLGLAVLRKWQSMWYLGWVWCSCRYSRRSPDTCRRLQSSTVHWFHRGLPPPAWTRECSVKTRAGTCKEHTFQHQTLSHHSRDTQEWFKWSFLENPKETIYSASELMQTEKKHVWYLFEGNIPKTYMIKAGFKWNTFCYVEKNVSMDTNSLRVLRKPFSPSVKWNQWI